MALDETTLPAKYELVRLNVASGTKLATRAADVVQNLSTGVASDKPVIVSLSTPSRNANKLISVVEIAKRELKATGIKVYQYSALSSETVHVERKPKQPASTAQEINDEAGNDSDDAFETMGDKHLHGPKQRTIPVMTTYLSVSSVKELMQKYG